MASFACICGHNVDYDDNDHRFVMVGNRIWYDVLEKVLASSLEIGELSAQLRYEYRPPEAYECAYCGRLHIYRDDESYAGGPIVVYTRESFSPGDFENVGSAIGGPLADREQSSN